MVGTSSSNELTRFRRLVAIEPATFCVPDLDVPGELAADAAGGRAKLKRCAPEGTGVERPDRRQHCAAQYEPAGCCE